MDLGLRRTRSAAVVLLVVAALCPPGLVAGPADAAVVPARGSAAPVYSGLAASLVRACVRETGSTGVTVAVVGTARVWSWVSRTETVIATADQPRASLSFGAAAPTPADASAAVAIADCMNARPLDWTLARTDSAVQSQLLYDYLRDVAVPCIRRTTGVDVPVPDRLRFVGMGLLGWDPYRAVTLGSVGDIVRLQGACPPAPRILFLRSTLLLRTPTEQVASGF